MPSADPGLEQVLEYLKQARAFDFTGYKRATLARRVKHRMQRVGIDDHDSYIDFLEVHPEEFVELFNTILINVSAFFRDPEREIAQGRVISPADGVVQSIMPWKDGRTRVAIFMSPLNVHVNRAPLSGTVTSVEHIPGGFVPAFNKESENNERVVWHFDTELGDIEMIQIAGAVVGLIKPGGLQGAGPSAPQFASAVFRAAEELGYGAPLFMSTAPLPFPGGEGAGERLHAEVQRYLDAGFSEIVLRCPPQLPEGAREALRTGLAAVREGEVSLALFAEQADHAAHALEELAGYVSFDLVSLDSSEGAGALDVPAIELPVAQLRPGLNGADLSAPLQALGERVLGERARPDRARDLESVDEATQLRLEALCYGEALALLRDEPFRGSAARVMRALAEKPGY